jgi:hypothetical protein
MRTGSDFGRTIGRGEPQCAVWPVLVVMPHVDTKDTLKMSATDD